MKPEGLLQSMFRSRTRRVQVSRHVRRIRPILVLADDSQLEERILLSTNFPLNVSTWTELGPAPINNGQVTGTGVATGRIVGIAASPTDPNLYYVAAASGGVTGCGKWP